MKPPRFYDTGHLLGAALSPLGALYTAAGVLRRALTRPHRLAVPVLCIGNLSLGGTGKTPVTADLAARLSRLGATPHILIRGYRGRLEGPVMVDPRRHRPEETGDEALLLAETATVWASPDRRASAEQAIQSGANVLLMDDGFQNPSLEKTASLLVFDAPAGLGNGYVFPAGPLREPLALGLRRADAAILIGAPDRHDLGARLDGRLPVFAADLAPPAESAQALKIRQWFAFAGIGRPQKFFDTLTAHGATLAGIRAFADHHPYRREELEDLAAAAAACGARLITTEKDAVRLPTPWRQKIDVLPVAIRWQTPEAVDDFLKTLPIRQGSSA